ncbi:MAG TPA: adenine phosphoribosyltransferase [Candidatus Altiarchaeales archaeon]|nr:adenine phosphoribosyltransferase [Candidatus Altiarchaeales archaeon]
MSLELLEKSLKNAQVITRGEYKYFIHPLTDSIPPIEPDLMMETCMALRDNLDINADYILTMEAMGIHIATVLGQLTGLPVNIIRKRQYWLPGEKILDQSTGYSKGTLYMNSVKPGDRILIVDAVVSTGGTLLAVLNALKEIGVDVAGIGCVIGRGGGKKIVEEKTGFKVKTLIDIDVKDKVEVTSKITG